MNDKPLQVLHIPVQIEGRVLLKMPAGPPPWPVLCGFHGYGELAEAQMNRLTSISAAQEWLLVSVQALHPFYLLKHRVGASWMTKLDRDKAIRQNVRYVDNVLDRLEKERRLMRPPVFAGFSQGTAMVCRTAALGRSGCAGVILLGGDVPEDLPVSDLRKLSRAVVGRGRDDRLYSQEQWRKDVQRLKNAGVAVTDLEVEGEHEWNSAFSAAADQMLNAVLSRLSR
ncbi:phospholipase [bacterium]|nr:phospholipase [bacterium]